MKYIDDLNKLYKDNPSRLNHIKSTYVKGIEIATHFNVNQEYLEEACLLHDITKYLTKEEHIKYIESYYINSENILKDYTPNLYHSFSAVPYIIKHFNITNKIILDAIMVHTVGKPKMNELEQVLFIADYTEDLREYDSSNNVRNVIKEYSLDELTYIIMDEQIRISKQRNKIIPEDAFIAHQYYQELVGELEWKK